MSLKKRQYTNGKTVISAQNLNDIQDAIIVLEETNLQISVSGTTLMIKSTSSDNQ